MVFVSYCTGDVHLGTLSQSYVAEDGYEIVNLPTSRGSQCKVRYRLGRRKICHQAKIMVAGASAGALASASLCWRSRKHLS